MPRRHVLLALLVVVIWGINFVVVDIGLETFPPLLFVGLRYVLALFPAVLFVPRPKTKLRYVIGVGMFIGCGQFSLLFVGMHLGMPPGLSSIVLQSQALFTVVFALGALRERPTGYQLAGLLIATSGIVVIGIDRGLHTDLMPLLMVIGAAASWGVGNIVSRRARADGLPLIVWSSFVPPIPLLALSLVFEGPTAIGRTFQNLTWTGIAALVYLAVVATLIGFGIWASLLRRYPAAAVAPFSLLVPVVGITAAWLVRGEQLTAAEFAGGALVLLGLMVLNRVLGRRRGADRKHGSADPVTVRDQAVD